MNHFSGLCCKYEWKCSIVDNYFSAGLHGIPSPQEYLFSSTSQDSLSKMVAVFDVKCPPGVEYLVDKVKVTTSFRKPQWNCFSNIHSRGHSLHWWRASSLHCWLHYPSSLAKPILFAFDLMRRGRLHCQNHHRNRSCQTRMSLGKWSSLFVELCITLLHFENSL